MASLSIVTFNIRYANPDDGINFVPSRLPLIVEKLRTSKPDVVGFQEFSNEMLDTLQPLLPEYILVYAGRMADRLGEGLAFLVRKETICLQGFDHYWLSSTPSIPASRYENSDQSALPRVMQRGLFVHKSTAFPPFRIYNLHTDHVGAEARCLELAQTVEQMRNDYDTDHLPFLLMGDLNAAPDSKEIAVIRNSNLPLSDLTKKFTVTFHGFFKASVPQQKIDYIFASPEWQAEEVRLWTDTRDGRYLSDHHPIEAKLTLSTDHHI